VTSETLTFPTALDGLTERFDPIKCFDQRLLGAAPPPEELEPGRYLEIQGPERRLLIPLGDDAPLHIGRGLGADVHLDDMSVSRRHAILLMTPTGARILDERSSNGTFVNGVSVQQAELNDGDVIALGRFLLRYLVV